MTSMLFMMISVPLGFAGTYVLNTFGLRYSMILSAFLNAAGTVVRYGGDYAQAPHSKLAAVFAGQAITAMAQPVFLDSPTLLAAQWFGESERAVANTLASVANPLGMAVASALTPAIVSKPADMRLMLLVMAIPALVGLIATVAFFKSRPPTPPSASASVESVNFKEGLGRLIRNPAYWALLFSFAVGIALISSVTSLLGQLTAGQGYSDDQAGYLGIVMIVAGLIGAGVAGALLDKYHCFLTIFKGAFVIAAISVVGIVFFDKPDHFALLATSCGILGLAAFSALPTGLELCVEITYPVNEGLSTGLIWIFSQALGTVLMFATSALAGDVVYVDNHGHVFHNVSHYSDDDDDYTEFHQYPRALYMFAGVTGAATIGALCIKTRYHRLEAEASHKTFNVQV
ncbi:uncharacterized protein MONBRDRAFT_9679 [Monosiga brevicollis MX1]|uniref:Major facilitator superfamily (MFS) profile domain-containing protein n=1 Tax=Monosiga brevicollis TaxID=81824 RepID=A9V3G1_MONBE|nr:uncharacterized protein MONBRDRAFT_9679 [Monosiga brevicollis MX1]EDQ87906.1 predicted protein [Monosiga brevicollis MX1]|eukprot:XP_001747439.1 hypothetical protein [Monosiga brevicollis MX1]